MFVYTLPLEPRPSGSGIIYSEGEMPLANINPGDTVTLRCREVKIVAQVLELEQDKFVVGQVLDFDGTLKPEIDGVNIGTYLRFREEHIWSAYAA
jgi:hypothetical protein